MQHLPYLALLPLTFGAGFYLTQPQEVDEEHRLAATIESLRAENSLVVWSYTTASTVTVRREDYFFFISEQTLRIRASVDYRLPLDNLTLDDGGQSIGGGTLFEAHGEACLKAESGIATNDPILNKSGYSAHDPFSVVSEGYAVDRRCSVCVQHLVDMVRQRARAPAAHTSSQIALGSTSASVTFCRRRIFILVQM